MAIVILKIAFIRPSTLPNIHSITCLFIHRIMPFVNLYLFAVLFPNSIAISKALLEITFERAAVLPHILSISFRQSIHVLSFVIITICEPFGALSMFQSILKYSDVKISIQFLVKPLTIRQPTPPLPFVIFDKLITFWVFRGKIKPIKSALSMFFTVQKLSNIQIAIRIDLHAFSIFLVIRKISFIQPSIFTDSYPFTLSLFTRNLSKIYLSIAFYQFQIFTLKQRFDGQANLWRRLVVSEQFTQLLLIVCEDMCQSSLLIDGLHSEYFYIESQLFSIKVTILFGKRHLDLGVVTFHLLIKLKYIRITYQSLGKKLQASAKLIHYEQIQNFTKNIAQVQGNQLKVSIQSQYYIGVKYLFVYGFQVQ